MNTKTYQQFRKSGYTALESLRNSKICAVFADLESRGLVRLRAIPEEESYFDVYGEPDGYVDIHGRRVSAEQERKELCETIERDGCWIIVSEWRESEDDLWNVADSVGMCVYSWPLCPLENCYVPDLMQAAIDYVESTCPVI